MINKIIRFFERRAKRYGKRYARHLLMVYLISAIPVGFLSTAVTNTQASITQPIKTIKILANSGLPNIATGGLLTPIRAIATATKNNFITGLNELSRSYKLPTTTQATNSQTTPSSSVATNDNTLLGIATSWTFNDAPNYYKVLGVSDINTADFPKEGKIVYGAFDSQGRTTTAKGSLTFENVKGSYGVRQTFTEADSPSGWGHNGKVAISWLNGRVYHGYFWNKSHLIADSLGGDAERDNVITGTRTQNVGGSDQKGGMRYSEKKAQSWLEANHIGVLYYEAQPIYNGNELVPRAVVVSMLSSDKTINEKVMVYNMANGFVVDYNTGTYHQ